MAVACCCPDRSTTLSLGRDDLEQRPAFRAQHLTNDNPRQWRLEPIPMMTADARLIKARTGVPWRLEPLR